MREAEGESGYVLNEYSGWLTVSRRVELQDIGPQEESRDPGAKSRREGSSKQSGVPGTGLVTFFVPSVRVVLHGDSSACPWGRFSQTM